MRSPGYRFYACILADFYPFKFPDCNSMEVFIGVFQKSTPADNGHFASEHGKNISEFSCHYAPPHNHQFSGEFFHTKEGMGSIYSLEIDPFDNRDMRS